MDKDLELWAYRYKEELLKHTGDYENGVDAVLSLSQEEMLLLIFEHLDISRNIDGYLVVCFATEKCRELQRKIQSVATQYFLYFLDNTLVKRKLWPVYEIIWAW